MFDKDLKVGQEAEIKFCEYLIMKGCKVVRTFGMNSDFDVGVYGENYITNTYEIKSDLLFPKTGNLAIEYAFKGDLSGVSTTNADYWVQAIITPLKAKFYVLEVSGFKDWLKQNKEYLKTTKGGDNEESQMILVKPSDIVNNSWCEVVEY